MPIRLGVKIVVPFVNKCRWFKKTSLAYKLGSTPCMKNESANPAGGSISIKSLAGLG